MALNIPTKGSYDFLNFGFFSHLTGKFSEACQHQAKNLE